MSAHAADTAQEDTAPFPRGVAGYYALREKLKEASYREYEVRPPSSTDTAFQKRIEEEGKTLYVVNVSLWNYGLYDALTWVGVEFWAHLYRGKRCLRIYTDRVPEYSISAAEALFREIYDKLGMTPDPYNQR